MGEATTFLEHIPALSWHIPSAAAIYRTDNNVTILWGKNHICIFISAISAAITAESRSLLLFECVVLLYN